jgi:predicted ATPase
MQLLATGRPAALPRQQTLRALIDWSFDLCPLEERTLWMRLSVFAGGFGLAAAEVVGSGGEIPREAVLDVLTGLVDKSVPVTHEGDEVRHRLLETIRQYGLERLAESGTEPDLRRRHRDHYADLIADPGQRLFGPDQPGVAEAASP